MTDDRAARDVARKDLTANIVVEAGAGTGKTTLLTDRALFLLLAGGPERAGVPVDRLVALTFTEKAAGEIKSRLAERLEDLGVRLAGGTPPPGRAERTDHWLREARESFGATDERLRRMAEDARRDLDRAPIGTIHAFCRSLLRLYPMEAGLSPSFEVDDGEAFESLFASEWMAWLEESLRPGVPDEASWRELLRHVGLADLADLARSLARAVRPAPDPADTARRWGALRDRLAAVSAGKPVPRRGKMMQSLEALAHRLDAVADALARPDAPLSGEDDGPEEAKTWPKEWEGRPGRGDYERALAVARTASPDGERALFRARRLLAPFVDRFRRKFRSSGWIGFDDLLRGARDLLAGVPEVRRELKARYDALLVDEFQDTDPLQGETLMFLSEAADSEAADWRGVTLAPGKLFIVGDPKQSIYRFRGADIRAYEAFVDHVVRQGGRRCDLLTSFRTHEGIVEPVNRLFEGLIVPESGRQPDYRPLRPRPGAASGGLEGVLVSGGGGAEDGPGVRESQSAEARWIARWIVENVARPGAPHRLGDVALLFRSASPLGVYMDALKAAGIPYLVESDRTFYSAPEVVDFLNLLRCLVDPQDRLSLIGLLRSPLVLLEDRHLATLADEGAWDLTRPSKSLPASVRRALREFHDWMDALRTASAGEDAGTIARRALRESPLLPTVGAAYHGEQSVSNLEKLARLAGEAAARGETLGDFVRRASRRAGEGVEEGESPLGDENTDAVRLLTVHKAKGLEYKVVFLPNLGAAVQAGARRPPVLRSDWSEGRVGLRLPRRKWADAAMALLDADEKSREADESVRLFYVAATRARDHLILLGREDAADGSFVRLMESVARREGEGWVLPDGTRVPVARVSVGIGASPRWPTARGAARPKSSAAGARRWALRLDAYRREQGRSIFVSPSSLAEEGAAVKSGEAPLGAAPDAAARLGELCHAALAALDFRSPDAAAAVRRAGARLAAQRPGADWDAVQGEAVRILSTFLDGPASRPLREGRVLLREAPVLYADGDRVVRGVLDVLYEHAGRRVVADYKTDRVAPGEEPGRAALHAAQGRAYLEGLRRTVGGDVDFEVIFLRTGRSVRPLGEKTGRST